MAFQYDRFLQWREANNDAGDLGEQNKDDLHELAKKLKNEIASLIEIPTISKARKRILRNGTKESEKAKPLSRLVSVPCDELLQKDKLVEMYLIYVAAQESSEIALRFFNFISDRYATTKDLRCRKAINRLAVYEMFSRYVHTIEHSQNDRMLISFSDADYKVLSKGLTANTDGAQFIESLHDLRVLEEFYEFCQRPNEAEMEFLRKMIGGATDEIRQWCKSAQPSQKCYLTPI